MPGSPLDRIKRGVKWLWRQPWVWRTLGTWTRPSGVAVLTYHRIARHEPFGGLSASVFESQMRWIGEHCRPIAPTELESELARPATTKPPVLVTFDDGYRDFHDVARPILERHGIPALVFLPTALIGTDELLWTDEVSWLLAGTDGERISLPALDGLELTLVDAAARARAAHRIKAGLKALADGVRREALIQLRHQCRPARPRPPRQMMNWDEVRACRDVALFGGHSHTHPILSRVDDEQLDAEIDRCRDTLAAELGAPPEFFAYPNGRAGDFDPRTRRAVKQAGFRIAFTTEPGWCNGGDWLAQPRLPTGASNLSGFAWLITHPKDAD